MLFRELQGAILILREYPAAQTVAAVIRQTHRVFVIFRADDRRDGPKDFIVKRRHTGFEVGQNGCGIIGPRTVRDLATAQHLGPFINAFFHLIAHGLELVLAGQRAQLNVFVGRITHIDLFHLGDEGIDKGVMDLIGDNKAFR